MPGRHNGTEQDESERGMRNRTTMQQKVLHLFLSEADSLSMGMLISGYLLGACESETHSTARVNLCSKLA
jgi:hypothetical protein